MSKTLLIAGLAVMLTAGVAAAQSAQPTPPPPPAPSYAPPGSGPDGGPGFGRHMGRGGPWMHRGMRHGRGQRPSAEEIRKRTADAFARMDANRDGRVTFEEFRQEQERRRLERQRQMFQRFSGGQDSVTLDQLNARILEREHDRGQRRDGRSGPQGSAPQPEQRPGR